MYSGLIAIKIIEFFTLNNQTANAREMKFIKVIVKTKKTYFWKKKNSISFEIYNFFVIAHAYKYEIFLSHYYLDTATLAH